MAGDEAQLEAGHGAYYGRENRAGVPGARPGRRPAPYSRAARSRADTTAARAPPGRCAGDIPEFAEALRVELVTRYRPMQCLVTPITPVIAAHAGIGAWGVFYQNED